MPIMIYSTDHDWTDVKQVEKFGANPDVDTDSDPEDVWDQGGTYTYLTSAATLYASSSDDGDTVSMNVQGLDASWDLQTVSVTLTGQTQVALSGTWLRVFRAYNEGATDLAGDVYIAETDDLTGGVPNTASKIKAKVQATHQQTMMAQYTIPNGYTGYMTRWYCSQAVAKSSYAVVEIQKRATGGVFRTARHIGLDSGANNSYQELLNIAIPFSAKTDIKAVVREVGANDMDIAAGFDLLLVADSG